MPLAQIVLTGYGFLLLTGAYFGLKAGSKISLIMGIVSGLMVLAGVFLTKTNQQLGYSMLVGVSLILTIVFLIRLMKTGALMPSGMLMAVSILALIVSFLKLKG